MSLWSSTTITADHDCARQGIRLRLGVRGRQWPGYRVGSWVHDWIHAQAADHEAPALGSLSVLEQRDAQFLMFRFDEMGLLHNAPGSAEWEESYLGLVNQDGSVYGWTKAPASAVRGAEWDPASFMDETWVRVQPDRWYVGLDGVAVVEDWKTALGTPADSSVDHHPQPIIYCAAIADVLHLDNEAPVRFYRWNLREGAGQMVEQTAGWFRARSRRLLAACYQRDQVTPEALEASLHGGEHCGRCPFDGLKCNGGNALEAISDEALWRSSTRLDGMAKKAKAAAKARMKARTSRLGLPDGTVIGPHVTRPPAFSTKRDDKPKVLEALESVARWALNEGEFKTLFRRSDLSLPKWMGQLPPEMQAKFDGLITDRKRTIYIQGRELFGEE